MTHVESLLTKKSEWSPAENRWVFTASLSSELSAHILADQVESLGSLIWSVTLNRLAPPLSDLKAVCEKLAQRVTGLVEPLKLLEVDAEKQIALLRSTEPSQRDSTVLYYEVRLSHHGATLSRYKADRVAGTPRQQISFALTHEAMAKLLSDFNLALS